MLKHTENISSFEIFEAHFWILVGIKFITARKRSLGQGDAFIASVIFVQGGLCLGGSLSRRVSVQGVSVQGSLSGRGALCLGGACPGGSLSRGRSLSGRPLDRDPPTVKSRRYVFYWNAFLLLHLFGL